MDVRAAVATCRRASRSKSPQSSWRGTARGRSDGRDQGDRRPVTPDEFTLSGADPEGLFPAILGP